MVDLFIDQRQYATLEFEIQHAANANKIAQSEIVLATGRLLAARGKILAAIEILDRQLAASSEGAPDVLRLKCQLLFEHAEADEAALSLEQLCQIVPDDGAAWHNLATAHQKAGRASAAVSHYEKSLSLRPDAPRTWLQLGNAWNELGEIVAAKSSWERARTLAPDDAFVRTVRE